MTHGLRTLVVALALIPAACSNDAHHEARSPSKMTPASGTRNDVDRGYTQPVTVTTTSPDRASGNLYDPPSGTGLGTGPGGYNGGGGPTSGGGTSGRGGSSSSAPAR